MKNVKNRTIGMLMDTYILAAVEQTINDKVQYAREEKEDVLATALSLINGDQLKMYLKDIINLTIERCMCSLSRRAAIFPPSQEKLAWEVNEFNARRTVSVRNIDQITNPDDLSYSPKTYTNKFVSTIRTNSILIDDYISTYIKSTLNASDDELAERADTLVNFLSKELDNKFSPDLAIELIKLSVGATLCFIVNEAQYSGSGSIVIQAAKDVVVTNKMRKTAMRRINELVGEDNE